MAHCMGKIGMNSSYELHRKLKCRKIILNNKKNSQCNRTILWQQSIEKKIIKLIQA